MGAENSDGKYDAKYRVHESDHGALETTRDTMTMLQEANHRIANSLALAGAVIELQQRRIDDVLAKEALTDTRLRIDAIASLHRLLVIDDTRQMVAMDDYLPMVVSGLQDVWSVPNAYRDINLSCDRMDMDPQQALSLMVVTNELVTNACKYAYPDRQRGSIDITLSNKTDGQFELTVSDQGIGKIRQPILPGHGLGSVIVERMVQSMRAGIIERSSSVGTSVAVFGYCVKPKI